ncbi:MAG TPA: hypothetical protein PLD95_03945 [bacterium]|jgi:type IV secretory pathway VirB2 component (pilin)|nr:hypothetical protein [bacterium]HOG38594.1 hypothetical protein [bacterium]
MKKLTKNLISLGVMAMIICLPLFNVPVVKAQLSGFNTHNLGYIPDVGLGNSTNAEATVLNVVRVVLGFLGFIALIVIIIAGFKWMTSGGNEEKIGAAKKMLGAGIIGLILILMSYVITSLIFGAAGSALNTRSGAGGSESGS